MKHFYGFPYQGLTLFENLFTHDESIFPGAKESNLQICIIFPVNSLLLSLNIALYWTLIGYYIVKGYMNRYKDLHIGLLALQGDYANHQFQLNLLGVKNSLVKLPEDLSEIDGLIIPGGESTTMDKLMDRFELREPLRLFGESKPIWGTCAGMILLAKAIAQNQAKVRPLGLMDIDVERTAYGRQVFSFDETVPARLNGSFIDLQASFIRAPKIRRLGDTIEVLAEYNGEAVLVKDRLRLASSFHTELSKDTRLLEYYLDEFFTGNSRKLNIY